MGIVDSKTDWNWSVTFEVDIINFESNQLLIAMHICHLFFEVLHMKGYIRVIK